MSSVVYANQGLRRDDVDSMKGTLVLEFGSTWCSICQDTQPLIEEALLGRNFNHLRVEDGPNRRLGRSFHIRLWPTLIFLQDGEELVRVVRPQSVRQIALGMAHCKERFRLGTDAGWLPEILR